MRNMLFILNPRAGLRRANLLMPEIIRLFNAHGYRCEVYVTGGPGEAARYLAEGGAKYNLVACAGGDGTLNETIAGVMRAGMECPIGYIPCGTTNDYAASIGLSNDILTAAEDIMEGVVRNLDIGTFTGRTFVYTATCGAFARASYATSQAAKNLLGHTAYILEGIKDLTSLKPIRLRVEANGQVYDDDFIFCSITNSTSLGGVLKLDAEMVALNDGEFEVTLIRNPTNPMQLTRILQGLTTLELPNEMIHFFSAARLSITSAMPVEWTLDGEREPETDSVTLRNLNRVLRIVLPQRHAEAPLEPVLEE